MFAAALGFAVGVFENGYDEIISERVVKLLVHRSAEIDALNKALNANSDIDLSKISLSSSLFGYSSSEYREHA